MSCNFTQDFPLAAEVVRALEWHKQNEAADYIRNTGKNLSTFIDSDELIGMFKWDQTKFGHTYWEDIYWDLVSTGEAEISDYICGEDKDDLDIADKDAIEDTKNWLTRFSFVTKN